VKILPRAGHRPAGRALCPLGAGRRVHGLHAVALRPWWSCAWRRGGRRGLQAACVSAEFRAFAANQSTRWRNGCERWRVVPTRRYFPSSPDGFIARWRH